MMIEIINESIYKHTLSQQELNIYFQPIVSINKKKIIGVEALTRAFYKGEPILPASLFRYAKAQDEGQALDTLCRNTALKNYKALPEQLFLFINLEATLLNYYVQQAENIMQFIRLHKINLQHIVLEINEKNIKNSADLANFIRCYGSKGFLIALDDVCEGYSNLNRIVLSKPDIVKIDRQMITDIDKDYYKQVVVTSIVNLASRIGALTIAEGVETTAQAVACLDLGIDLFQGFYFSKAIPASDIGCLDMEAQFYEVAGLYKKHNAEKIAKTRKRRQNYRTTLEILVLRLRSALSVNYDDVIKEFLKEYSDIECIYILDRNGYQVTSTVFNPCSLLTETNLFKPAKKLDCHDLKAYYYNALLLEPEIFLSEPYISMATGELCETISMAFTDSDCASNIACIDYAVGNINKLQESAPFVSKE